MNIFTDIKYVMPYGSSICIHTGTIVIMIGTKCGWCDYKIELLTKNNWFLFSSKCDELG